MRQTPLRIGDTIKPLRAAAEFAIDLLYPKRCAGCGRRGTWLCGHCGTAPQLFAPPWCDGCGIPAVYTRCLCASTPENLDQVRSVGPFDGWLRGAIAHYKYHGEWARAAHLGELLATVTGDMQSIDMLIPVPLHATRLRHRGFNQSLLLAQRAGDILEIDVHDALIRTRGTEAQVNLGSTQRLANVDGAFTIRCGMVVSGLSIVLIDDVVTTGATLSACADALRDAGASSVSAATIAREM